ncbi:MAG: hypothetical protein IJO83_01655 [Clostridia bacterium]|nr:hypothetical protein [Clostridia bacterium]
MSFNDENFQFKQEADMFMSLAPYSLIQTVFRKGQIPYSDYITNIRFLKAVGLTEFAEAYLISDHADFRKQTYAFFHCEAAFSEFNEKPLVKEFILNIHSPEIRQMFIKRVNEYYNEKIFNES